MIPENKGAPDAKAIPRQSGNATKKTTNPAGRSEDIFPKIPELTLKSLADLFMCSIELIKKIDVENDTQIYNPFKTSIDILDYNIENQWITISGRNLLSETIDYIYDNRY